MALSLGLTALAILACMTLLWTAKLVATNWSNPLNKIPGPIYAKWSNLGLKLATITGRRIYFVHSLHTKYGPYVRLSPEEVSVADPEAFAQIHRISSGFSKSPWYGNFAHWSRPILFTLMNNREHAARRKILARGFSKTNLRQHWEPVVQQKVHEAVRRMKDDASKGTADIFNWWTLMASDVTCRLSFGNDFGMVEKGEKSEYIRMVQSTNLGGGIAVELPFVRALGRRIPLPSFREIFCSLPYLYEFAGRAVTASKSEGGSKNLFANIIQEAEKGEHLDDEDVRLEAGAIIIAGSDTTAVSLTYLVWAVLQRPALQQALQHEVSFLPDNFTDQNTEELPILNAVIEETLRLYCAAPGGLPRSVPADGTTLGGYYFPPGSVVTTQAYTFHRDANVFPHPNQFDHTRWLLPLTTATIDSSFSSTSSSSSDDHKATTTTTTNNNNNSSTTVKFNPSAAPATYNPFGAGARSCLGIHLARMELRLGAAEFFRQCPGARLAASTTPESMEMENYFLIVPKSHRCEITLI